MTKSYLISILSLVYTRICSLGVEIMCYFATKSIDEFLGLQQTAYVEVMRAVESCGAQLALPPLGAYTAAMGANAYAYGVGGLPAMPTVASTQPRITPLPPPPPTVSTTAVTSVTAASLMATVAAMPLTSVVSAAALPTSPVNAPTAVSTVDVLPTPASVTRQAGATSTLSSVAVQAAPAPAPVSVSSIPGAMSGKAIASSGNPSTTRP